MSYYDIRTMNGHEVLVGLINSKNAPLVLHPEKVTFSDVTLIPTPERLGNTSFTLKVVGFSNTVDLTYGRIPLASAFQEPTPILMLPVSTEVELIAKLNEIFNLNIGLDDYISVGENPIPIDAMSFQYTLTASPNSLVWYSNVTLDIAFITERQLEDGTVRLTEDISNRILELE